MAEAERADLSFEAALARLEAIVRQLESGDASLEDSITLYNEGQALKAHCEAKLETASARIEAIQANAAGDPVAAHPFGEAIATRPFAGPTDPQ